MKLTIAQRWVRWIASQDANLHSYRWGYIMFWVIAGANGAMATAMVNSDATWCMTCAFAFVGFILWERVGWIDWMNAKDADLRQLRESRDDLRRQLDALLINQRGGEPETRIRE